MESITDIASTDVSIDTSDIVTEAAESMARQMEYELRGAWRAGFDYVHVYDDASLGMADPAETVALTQYVLPSNRQEPPRPTDRIYRYTYDLGSVPDDAIRAAIRGDIDPDDFREVRDD